MNPYPSPEGAPLTAAPGFSEVVSGRRPKPPKGRSCPLGVLPGEGIGPEVVGAALSVLDAVQDCTGREFEIRYGGEIGDAAERAQGAALTDEVTAFCDELFADGAPLFAGAGGGRFVYELRRRFDLFCKVNPVQPAPELEGTRQLRPEATRDVDMLVVRDNSGGVYQGVWGTEGSPPNRAATHSFSYTESQVRRVVEVGARLAAQRGGDMTVVIKSAGTPSISDLWRQTAAEVATGAGVGHACLEADHVAYLMIQEASRLDVVVAPNLLGDVLSDLGGALMGSRGLTFGMSFSSNGAAAYQTNHGAALDLVGTDSANPVGQVLALASLLRESWAMRREADAIEGAVRAVWRDGWRTADLSEPGTRPAGTRRFGELIAEQTAAFLGTG